MRVIAAGLNDSLQLGAQPGNPKFISSPVTLDLPSGRLVSASAGPSQSIFVYGGGAVYVLGDASHFLPADSEEKLYSTPTRVEVSPSAPALSQVVCGLDFSVFLTRDGVVIYKRSEGTNPPLQFRPSVWTAYIDAGVTAPCALDAEGSVFVFCKDPTKKVDKYKLGHPVFDIARGREFILAIRTDGVVWGYGAVNGGKEQFTKVQSLGGVRCTRAFAGEDHAVVIDSEGSVWVWGSGQNGKLGNGSEKDLQDFQKLDAFGGKRVIHAALGKDFTLFLTEDRSVYGCGGNQYGQLLLGTTQEKVLTPQKAALENVMWLVCGAHHSLAFTGMKEPVHGGVIALKMCEEFAEDKDEITLRNDETALMDEIETLKWQNKQLYEMLLETRKDRDKWKARCKELEKKIKK